MTPAVVTGPLSIMKRISSRRARGMAPPGLPGGSAARQTGCFEEGELVGDLGGGQRPAGDGRVGVRRGEVGEVVGRSHGGLVDTVGDARAIPARDGEREIRV